MSSLKWTIALRSKVEFVESSARVLVRKSEVVTVKDTRADISGNGKTDSDGFYKVVLHLHNENQGDPLFVQSREFEVTGRMDLDPNDPKTERIVTVNLSDSTVLFHFGARNGLLEEA